MCINGTLFKSVILLTQCQQIILKSAVH